MSSEIEEEKPCQEIPQESKCLLILNLQRPFVSQTLESLLNKFGNVHRLWLDFIKTHCYVEVSLFGLKKFYLVSMHLSKKPKMPKKIWTG
jgi:hypothetical protein